MKTSFFSLLCVALRLAAIWFGFEMLLVVAAAARIAASASGDSRELLAACGLAVCGLLIAAALWLWPSSLVRLAANKASHEVFESPVSIADMQYLAFSLLGLWFAFDGIVRLIHEILMALGVQQTYGYTGFADLFRLQLADELTSGARVLIGLSLMFGARGLVGLLRGFRERGLTAPSMDEMGRSETGR